MSSINPFDKPIFERWVILNYPQIFENYELSEAAEYLDLDEWLERCTAYQVIIEWRKHRAAQQREGGRDA